VTSAAVLLLAEPVSAPVTQWPVRILLVLGVLAVIALVLLGMRRGWKRRAASQADVPAPELPPETMGTVAAGPVGGVFLGTTRHGDWLDRIVVHDLGVRSRAVVEVGDVGIAMRREGARDVLVPVESVRGATLARGIAGKAYERDGVLVITWDLGGRLVDTGFRADSAEDQQRILDAVAGFMVDEEGRR
jgi:hypothetical protein